MGLLDQWIYILSKVFDVVSWITVTVIQGN